MKSNEQISKEMHEIAKGISEFSSCAPFVSILQPRRDFREQPAQLLQPNDRMVDFTSMSMSYHAIDKNPVDISRCYLINEAIKENAKYALFVDEDTVLPCYGAFNLIEASMKHPDAIIVGVYYFKLGRPMISYLDEGHRSFPADVTPNTGLLRDIPLCGLGCALIPLSVIKKIQAKFQDIPLFCIVPPNYWGDPSVKAISEDAWFYRLVSLCGVEVICDTSVQCLHMELSTGKYTAHPNINLDDYITNVPIASRLILKDRERILTDYMSRTRQAAFVNGFDNPIVSLPVDYSKETFEIVKNCLTDVQCTQNYYEISRLCERLKKLEPQTVLEIGIDKGGSMNVWLQFAKSDGLYVGVDTTAKFIAKREHKQVKKFIEADSCNPETLEKVKEALGGKQVDFLFIDGGYDERTVTSDFNMYSPLVRKGGIIAFHDIHDGASFGVKKLWEVLKKVYENEPNVIEEFVNTEAQMPFGIGMIKVP